ncbi:MAG: twitching motility protein twitching motility protein PilT [Parcubacteria group bacterium]|nr:twitching motility protein twitching motility protein PilT [Parcubacteria group bacterium]
MASQQLLNQLVDIVTKEGASDLHLSEGRSPVIRVAGFLIPLLKIAPLTKSDLETFLEIFLTAENKRQYMAYKEANFAYSHESVRFRGNAFMKIGKMSVALRLIQSRIRTLAELGLPTILETFTKKQQGFFLVVGPAGQGKSTTLASMIEMINEERLEHIITIEDPIEYIFEPKKALIDQREVGSDTPDFKTALWGAFRQDADVIMVGEMREPETIATAVTAAETGHLVYSTLHTNTAAQTVDRIIDSFPSDQQDQIRIQLSSSLIGIFSQRLIPRISGGLIPAFELLLNNNAVSNLIREKRSHEINSVIETGSEDGMIDLNRSLAILVRNGEITAENAMLYSTNPRTLERMI